MSDDSQSFIQEVNEGVRQDQVMAAIKRWGPWAGGALALVLLVVFIVIQIGEHNVSEARKASDQFAAALEKAANGDTAAAAEAFGELTENGPQVYRSLALMERAALLEQQGELDEAVTAFDSVAENAKDPLVRDMAQIRAAYIVAETQDFPALQARLQPLIESETPVAYLARELLGIEAWDAGEEELARTTLENLSLAFETPDSVRNRAEMALAVLGPAPEAESAEGGEEQSGDADDEGAAAAGENG